MNQRRIPLILALIACWTIDGNSALAQELNDSSVLPFPPVPMDSVVKPRLQDSTMKWPAPPKRLPDDAPNILIVLLDDTGFGVSEVFGGEVETPAFRKLAAIIIRFDWQRSPKPRRAFSATSAASRRALRPSPRP